MTIIHDLAEFYDEIGECNDEWNDSQRDKIAKLAAARRLVAGKG